MSRLASRLDATVLRVLTHLGALVPLAALLADLAGGRLSVNPIEDVQLRTGRYALLMLLLSLAATPLSRILRLPQVKPLRKTLGLYAFGYAGLHMLNFIGLDYRFDVSLIGDGILEKPFVLAGIAALLVLVPLAITSTAGWQTRLGKRWPSLHRLVYLAIVLVLVHFTLQEKGDFTRPAIYGTVAAALLLARLPLVRRITDAARVRRLTRPGQRRTVRNRTRAPGHKGVPEVVGRMLDAARRRKQHTNWQKKHDALAPKTGDEAPEFEVGAARGENRLRLSDFRGKKPVALVFGSYT